MARSFSFAAAEKTVLKPCIGTAKDIGYCINDKRFENGKMSWPQNQNEVQALSYEQVDWLMKGFAIKPISKV